MKRLITIIVGAALITALFHGCNLNQGSEASLSPGDSLIQSKINELSVVKLTTDLSKLSEKEKQMIPLLIDAAKIIDDLFWKQTLGDKDKFFVSLPDSL
ncbi:MAG: Zn-dependent hydrolase, partial [Bacteroidota bacterium]